MPCIDRMRRHKVRMPLVLLKEDVTRGHVTFGAGGPVR